MKIGWQIKFVVVNKQADSLHSLIAGGNYRATSLSRNRWKTLISSQASLQLNCNKEGFNAVCSYRVSHASIARIGILGNKNMPASVVTPESGLVLEELVMTPTLAAITRAAAVKQIMETRISKQWDLSLCSNHGHLQDSDNKGNHIMAMVYILVH